MLRMLREVNTKAIRTRKRQEQGGRAKSKHEKGKV